MKPITVTGRVIHGSGIGKKLGLPPTMNIEVEKMSASLETGIYVVKICEADFRATLPHTPYPLYNGVVHYGPRPAVSAPDSFEVHCFEFSEDWYGKEVTIEMLEKLREVQNFVSIDELRSAIEEDIKHARDILGLPHVST